MKEIFLDGSHKPVSTLTFFCNDAREELVYCGGTCEFDFSDITCNKDISWEIKDYIGAYFSAGGLNLKVYIIKANIDENTLIFA